MNEERNELSHSDLFAGQVKIGDRVTYWCIPYRDAPKTIRTGVFSMWDYESAGGMQGEYRTGKYVIDRDDGLVDLICYDQIVLANAEDKRG